MVKRSFIMAYSIVAFAALAAAVLWFSISVSTEASRGTAEAERTFSWLSRETSRNSYSLGFLTDAYIDEMTEVCRRTSTLTAMTISTPSGTIYAWPSESEAFTYSMNGEPSIQKTSFFTRVFNANIDMGANASPAVQITAAIRILPSSVIFNASRNSFILIFLVLISAIAVLLLTGKASDEKIGSGGARQKRSDSFFDDDKLDFDFESGEQPEEKSPSVDEADGEPFSNAFRISPLETSRPSFGLDEDAGAQNTPDSPPEAASAQTERQEGCADEAVRTDDGQPRGLFSKTSGLGWQEYLEERLDAELTRAASFEQDTGLLIIRVFNLDRTDMTFRRIADILVDTFKYRDMLFEYGGNAFACIVPGASLDEIMQTADRLYADIQDLLTEMQRKSKICIGITTRTSRILPASRMIEEADTAAKKAEEEQRLPIVAFRANPDKYRDYVVRNMHKTDGDAS